MAIKLQKTGSAITGNNFIANERITQAETLTKKGSPWKGRYYRAIGNMEKIPVLGSIVLAADKRRDPMIAQREKAWKISQFSPSQKQLDQVQKIWTNECAEQGIGTLKSPTPQNTTRTSASEPKPRPAKASLDGFELTAEDTNNFNSTLTFALACLAPGLPIVLMTLSSIMPKIEEMLQQADSSDEIPPIIKTIIKRFNPSYLVYPTIVGRIVTQVTAPNLLNPIGFFKSLWQISAPGATVRRIPQTQRQLTRSWKGILACYNNIGKASAFDIASNLAIHSINAVGIVVSHYYVANIAFQNMWYLSTAFANRITPWIGASEAVKQMNATCPAAETFSLWNLAGLKDAPWKTLFSWKESPLWNFVPIVGFKNYMPVSGLDLTPIFSCGSNKLPSLATATSLAIGYLTSLLGYGNEQADQTPTT